MTRTSVPKPGTPLWDDTTSASPRPPLTQSSDIDVAIIGAGFTGLWSAYYLLRQDPSLRLAIFEREHIGFGASGRNGGWASAIFPVSVDRVAQQYGHEAALNLQHEMNDTVTEIGRVIDKEKLSCDFAHHGFLSFARNKAQLARAKATVASAKRQGLSQQWELLSGHAATERVAVHAGTDSSLPFGALYTEHCALVNPLKLVHGLAKTIERLGGRIYEQSPVTAVAPGRVEVLGHRVNATNIIRATEAYTAEFPDTKREMVPLYSLVVATEPLPEATWEELGFTSRTAFNDMRNLRIYAHPTAERRLLFGGRGAPYHLGSKIDPAYDVHKKIHRNIAHTVHELFPQLQHTRLSHRWGGPLAVPRDWFPSVSYDRNTGIATPGAYVGDGVATSNLFGRILADQILGNETAITRLPVAHHRRRRWEVEPIRWAGVTAGLTAAKTADVEERLTGRPSLVSTMLEKLTGAH